MTRCNKLSSPMQISRTWIARAWIIGSVLVLFTGFELTQFAPAFSQSISQATDEQEVLQPVTRINPKIPMRVVIINNARQVVEYGLTTNRPRQIAPGAQQTNRNPVPLPAEGVFYPIIAGSDQFQQPAFKLDVSVTNNVLTIKIRQIQDGAEGHSVVRVRRNGSVYVF